MLLSFAFLLLQPATLLAFSESIDASCERQQVVAARPLLAISRVEQELTAYLRGANLIGNPGPRVQYAAIYGADDRKEVERGVFPYRSFGLVTSHLESGRQFKCTSTLVGPCHVLTNAHCLKKNQAGSYYPISFQTAFDAESASVLSVRSGSYRDEDNNTTDQDWAVLKINKKLGTKFGWLGVRGDPVGDGTIGANRNKLNLTAYHLDVNQGKLSTANNVDVFGGHGNYLYHNADSHHASGGPLWYTDSSNNTWLVGMQTLEPPASGGRNPTFPRADHTNGSIGISSRTFVDAVRKSLEEGCN